MFIAPNKSVTEIEATGPSKPVVFLSRALAAVGIVYAFLAGLRTVADFDLGWQLATGRWIAQHHGIFSTDVFSYTAFGQPWIYPALSGLIFYACFLMGGYALLSWTGAVACSATTALLLRKNGFAVSALALLAVPLIANRTQPRAEMFTTILFAAFLVLLWKHFRGSRMPLWMLPVLMMFWVNLHPGFVSGLGLCGAYLLLEGSDLLFAQRRNAAIARLQRSWKWLGLTAAATVLNPWGPVIYVALIRQNRVQAFHNQWIVEWENARLSWESWHQAIDWRDPQSAFWWLMAAATAGACIALWRRQFGAAVLLLASAYFAFQHVRLQAVFACMVVVIAGSLMNELWIEFEAHLRLRSTSQRTNFSIYSLSVASVLIIGLVAIRSSDLVSNRFYMRSAQRSWFGAGLSWWYPERAFDFLRREKLPANVFTPFSLGGFATWRLFPEYRDYIDGRAIPFGQRFFLRASELMSQNPDSSAWNAEAIAQGINTIVVPLSRYQGMTVFPQLQAYCRSQSWRPVYIDEVSAIFVRRTPANDGLIQRLALDCNQASFPPLAGNTGQSKNSRARLFNAWANAGGVLYSLGRYSEALAYLDRAQSVFQENASVHLFRALVLQELGRPSEAESEFTASLKLEPSDEAWFDLGLFYMTERRYEDAARIFGEGAAYSARPHEMWMLLGQAQLQLHQPQDAIVSLDKAEQTSPFQPDDAFGAPFYSVVATGRAKAYYQLGDVARAVTFQEDAVRLAPSDSRLWSGLADLYDAQGRPTKAAEARGHAAPR